MVVPAVLANSRTTPKQPRLMATVGPPAPMTPNSQLTQQLHHPHQVPLPIPKNLVLLAMIEAAERSCRADDVVTNENRSPNSPIKEETELQDDEEEIRVITGMATLAGPCGTYAVREPEGLIVFQQDPRSCHDATDKIRNQTSTAVLKDFSVSNLSTDATESHPLSLLQHSMSNSSYCNTRDVVFRPRAESPPNGIDGNSNDLGHHTKGQEHLGTILPLRDHDDEEVEEGRSVSRVTYGQKLQIVSFHDNVAVLARHQGYIVATSSQLVKIGGPKEECCFLEGVLETVTAQGHELQLHVQQHEKIERNLQERLRAARARPPLFPIVSEASTPLHALKSSPPPTPSRKPSSLSHPLTPDYKTLLQPSLQSPTDISDPPYALLTSSLTTDDPLILHQQQGYVRATKACPPMPDSPASIDNADLPDVSRASGSRASTAVPTLFETAVLTTAKSFSGHLQDHLEGVSQSLIHRPEVHEFRPTTSTLSRFPLPPILPHHQQMPSQSSSFDSVDFRTGLSGHYGLTTAFKKSFKHHPHAAHQQQQRTRRLMGVHGGLGGLGTTARPKNASSSSNSYSNWGV